jgi:hypothetical protein
MVKLWFNSQRETGKEVPEVEWAKPGEDNALVRITVHYIEV